MTTTPPEAPADVDDERCMTVQTEPSPDGGTGYTVVVTAGGHHTRVLNPDEARRHAAAVLQAAGYAEYDAAVAAQLRSLRGPDGGHAVSIPAVSSVLAVMHSERAPLDTAASAPLRLVPVLSGETTLAPFLTIAFDDGVPLGVWTPGDAREYAVHVLSAITAAELDGAYLRILRARLHIPDEVARRIVGDVSLHRHTEEDGR